MEAVSQIDAPEFGIIDEDTLREVAEARGATVLFEESVLEQVFARLDQVEPLLRGETSCVIVDQSLQEHSYKENRKMRVKIMNGKKTAIVAALGVFLVTLASCGKSGAVRNDRTEIAESEYMGYLDKIFAANQREAVFKNHKYMIMTVDTGIDAGEYKADFNWFKEDVTYYSAPAYEEFSTPDVRGEIVGIGTDWNPVATYYLDMMEGGYQYWPMPTEKSDWYDPAHEKIIEMYIQDGKLYSTSAYDEAGTEAFYKVLLPQCEYTGGTVRFTLTVDAETYEYIESSSVLEKDGTSQMLLTEHYEYDQPVPRYVDSIAGFFGRYSENTVTVTATAHPGEENEITKSVTVPVNSMVAFNTPDMAEPEYFTDYECTKPYDEQWDKMTDLTVFIKDKEGSK